MSVAPSVKLFVAMLSPIDSDNDAVLQMMIEVFGSIDFIGAPHPFDVTDYYEDEMGPNLTRRILGFTGPHQADILVGTKLACIELERALSMEGNRTVNLDIGYLDHNKIVLASTKGAGQKIYLDSGIYADFVARYTHGSYKPFEWSFPDFKDGRYDREFAALRKLLLEQEMLSV
jgi:hypothetical protein